MAEAAKPIICGEALINRVIIESIIPTKEAVPNFSVAHVTSKSVKKTAKSQNIGSVNQAKPNGPNVKLSATHKAQKTLIKAMSTALKYA
ncbi:MAG: hypothetical protein OEW71_00210 [Candidatus Bathyarchaeota archaeon]|nr:hypothetical protein [Candidatus Bathyarchaeota archaeon]